MSPTPRVRRNINHASHAHGAVCSAKVIIRSGLRKGEFIDCPRIRKNSLATVHVARRTKQPVSHAINSAGDTVTVADPGPRHDIMYMNVKCARYKGEILYCDIESFGRRRFRRGRTRARSRCWSGGSSSRWAEHSDSSRDEQQQAKDSPQSQRDKCAVCLRCHKIAVKPATVFLPRSEMKSQYLFNRPNGSASEMRATPRLSLRGRTSLNVHLRWSV